MEKNEEKCMGRKMMMMMQLGEIIVRLGATLRLKVGTLALRDVPACSIDKSLGRAY